MEIVSETSKVYLEQMDCHIYSEEGVRILSPLEFSIHYSSKNAQTLLKDLSALIRTLKP